MRRIGLVPLKGKKLVLYIGCVMAFDDLDDLDFLSSCGLCQASWLFKPELFAVNSPERRNVAGEPVRRAYV